MTCLVEFFEFVVHRPKKRCASARISSMRSTSAVGVVEIEARARGAGHAELAHERLVAVMAAAQGEAVLVGVGGEIVRVRPVHDEADEAAALAARAEDAHAGNLREAVDRALRELRVVREDALAADARRGNRMAAARPMAPAMFGVPASKRCGAGL